MFISATGNICECLYMPHLALKCEHKYVEIKCQLDATEVFIADLIACSTCFGHHYAHHQELKRAEGYASGLQDASCILQTGRITLSSTPDQLLEKPQHEIPQAATAV